MPAYWVARSRIIDAAEYKKYTDRVPAIIAKYGGKVLARGGRFQIMEGPDKFHRFVVIELRRGRRLPPQGGGRGRNHHRRGRRRNAALDLEAASCLWREREKSF